MLNMDFSVVGNVQKHWSNFDIRDIKTSMHSYMIQKVYRQLYGIKLTYYIKYSRHWSDLKQNDGIIEDDDFFKNKQQTTLSMIGAFRDTMKQRYLIYFIYLIKLFY